MHLLRLVLITLICWALAGFLLYQIFAGLKSGKIAHSATNQWCSRSKNAVGFWSLVLLFLGFASLALYAWWQAVAR